MRITNIIALIILILVVVQTEKVQAQDRTELAHDLVILNNGDEFVGTITEYVAGSHVVLLSHANHNFRFEAVIVRQVKQGYLLKRPKEDRPFKLDKFYYTAELGTIASSNRDYGLHANAGVVRQFNQWLGLGVGISYTDYAEYYDKMERLATYVSLRSYFRDDFVTPYSELNLGYGFVMDHFDEFETVYNNGFYANPKFGLRFGSTDIMWTVHVGASIQHTKSELVENPWGSWQEDRLLKRTQLGFGLIF